MTFGITLTVKEKAALEKVLTEIEKNQDHEITRQQRTLTTYKFIQEKVIPHRAEMRDRRSQRRESLQESHGSQLKWTHSRPPRHATTR